MLVAVGEAEVQQVLEALEGVVEAQSTTTQQPQAEV
jgi:hypothetical protein